ncbi:MAG TPA: hypothetical protein PK156_48710, partial [Polyangium sp.]|nr:hypothetical protein [Polyangium sp.]
DACGAGNIYWITFGGGMRDVGSQACCMNNTCFTCSTVCCSGSAAQLPKTAGFRLCEQQAAAACEPSGVFQDYFDHEPIMPNHAQCVQPSGTCIPVCCDGTIPYGTMGTQQDCITNAGSACLSGGGPMEIFYNGVRVFLSVTPAVCPSLVDCDAYCDSTLVRHSQTYDCVKCNASAPSCTAPAIKMVYFNGSTTCPAPPPP